MIDGIYEITFRGAADWGMGMLVLQGGHITGSDVGGVYYDGTYSENGDQIDINLILTVPPGVMLVQGTPPQPKKYEVKMDWSLHKSNLSDKKPVLIDLPPGPVNVIFNRLRDL